ncbi:MAG: glycosyltransferase N-terminal domain-containing protein [Bacteroidota bacterium]
MLIYSLAISLYNLAIFLAKPFNKKAALLVNGRKNTASILKKFTRDSSRQLAWFHCASLGEFEQARPVIEQLKREKNIQVAISFFSPSGYEVRKNYDLADVVFYLPSDSHLHAQLVLDTLKPDMAFFVKYEIWVRYITEITKRNIQLYLLSATFRPSHIYFRWYGKHLKRALQCFDVIFTQDQASLALLKNNGLPNAVFSNDTRYDRVYDQSMHPKPLPLVRSFKGPGKLLVLGSSYTHEETFAAALIKHHPDLKVVIAPHHINKERIEEIEKQFSFTATLTYSAATEASASSAQVLIIDNIGLLSSIYQYAEIAFIGGGFGSNGIHNTLEAATFGMPVLIGPNNHERFPETGLMTGRKILFTVAAAETFVETMVAFLTDRALLHQTGLAARNFIKENTGATAVIINHIKH